MGESYGDYLEEMAGLEAQLNRLKQLAQQHKDLPRQLYTACPSATSELGIFCGRVGQIIEEFYREINRQ